MLSVFSSYDIFAIVAMATTFLFLWIILALTIERTLNGKKMLGNNYTLIAISSIGIAGIAIFACRFYCYPDDLLLEIFSMTFYYGFLVILGMPPLSLLPIIGALDKKVTESRIKILVILNIMINVILSVLALVNYFYESIGVSFS